jgi:hypothetical protein
MTGFQVGKLKQSKWENLLLNNFWWVFLTIKELELLTQYLVSFIFKILFIHHS